MIQKFISIIIMIVICGLGPSFILGMDKQEKKGKSNSVLHRMRRSTSTVKSSKELIISPSDFKVPIILPDFIVLQALNTENNCHNNVHLIAPLILTLRCTCKNINHKLRQEEIIKHGISISPTILHKAATSDINSAALYAEHGDENEKSKKGYVNSVDRLGNTALHLASSELIVTALLEAKANPNIRNFSGDTPLNLLVSRSNSVKSAVRLLDAGADQDICNNEGDTPLHAAVKTKRDEKKALFVKLLLERDAKVDIYNQNGDTPLSLAATEFSRINQSEICEVMRLLLSRSLDENAASNLLPKIVLKILAYNHHPEATVRMSSSIVKMLLDCKADPNIRLFRGQRSKNISMLGLAIHCKDKAMIDYLISAGADKKEFIESIEDFERDCEEILSSNAR